MIVRTQDHPEANGRQPEANEVGYRLWFPLEDGSMLLVLMGPESWAKLRSVVTAAMADGN